ncbi:glycosyltransferase family 4 protein [Psychroserpens mesophilus]|uniref:glycosyltransferase family 4 protein n=1 Tax=Psychroserpens mesophilus TaxID=325473 RepID=UPI003D65F743
MKTKTKIAVYSGSIPSTTFIERLILGLSTKGYQIYLFGFRKHNVKYNAFVKVVSYKNTKFYKSLHLLKYSLLLVLFKPKEKQKLDAILRSKSQNALLDKTKCYPVLWYKPDIFHIQWAKNLEYWSWVQEFNIKLILSLRGAHINYSPIADRGLANLYRNYFPKVDGFHAVSKAIAYEAEKYKAQPEKIKVVYSGLNLKTFDFSSKRNESNFNIVSIGRPHWKKGYNYALDACSILKKSNIPFTYTIVGAKGYLELLYQIKDLGLEKDVILLGSQSLDEVKRILKEASVFLLPSVEEGIANVVLEAMASGTLVLTTNCGGMEEVVENKINGFVCSIRNPNSIAEQIKSIINLPEEHKNQILNRAKETITKQHTEEQMINGMLEMYSDTLKGDMR